jgi:hypothetical protein
MSLSILSGGTGNLDQERRYAYKATELFRTQRARAQWGRLWSRLWGRSKEISCLVGEKGLSGRRGRRLGVQTVPIRKIRGSEGRCSDFDEHFRPLRKHTKRRWVNMCCAWLDGVVMPPVDLVLVGDEYYVRDGHHRISVARALGQQHIEAEVTAWEGAQREPKPR